MFAMPDKIESAKLICRGGLDSNNNYLELSEQTPGSATQLINYEPSLFGGYRRLEGFEPLNETQPEVAPTVAEGPILGVMIFNEDIFAARKHQGASTYGIFLLDGPGWTEIPTGLTLSSVGVSKVRYETFNFNGTEILTFVDGTNNAVIYNQTTWAQIKTTGTGANYANAGGPQALAAPKYVHVFYNHVFYSGDADFPHLVVHSAPQKEFDFTSASGAGQIIAGFAVNQIKAYRDSLFVFGQTNIKKINASQTTFIINDVAKNIGCIASDSVVEINGDILFLSQDGIRPITSTDRIGDVELSTVSKPIQALVRSRINDSSFSEINAVVVPSKSQVRFFFADGNLSPELNRGIIGGLKSAADGFYWEWGEIWGIRVACTTSAYINASEYILHGDYNGKVYRQERGKSFDGKSIFSVYQTPYLDYGDPQVRKTLRTVSVFTRPEGPVTIDFGVNYDYGNTSAINPADYNLTSGGMFSSYGTAVYADPTSTYGAITAPMMLQNIQGSGYSAQFTFVTNDISDPFSIQGLLFEFSVNGRN